MPLILPKSGEYAFEEKRSKFIGYCTPIDSEEGAKQIIAKIRVAHPKANHNVYAYCVNNIPRMSDDGEPQGTGGMPILNVYEKSGIINYVCVVTRYFGGTLLGAGGLVRAYSKAAKGAMDAAEPEALVIRKTFKVTCAYALLDKTKYNFDKLGFEILDVEYTSDCTLTMSITEAQLPQFMQEISYGYTATEIL
ncbi:MAG: IMPACT family protein [Defluviitaleaceae bacterium]|nr:IMPACT family protein [Defluviitaleaceae bacterium]